MRFSVLIPAHNEERYIEKCLLSIEQARIEANCAVEIIVCLNRCSDKTQTIAEKFGAIIVREDEKNLSKIRNRAALAATGDVIVTIDADSRMSKNMFREIERLLLSGKHIGGGTIIKPERYSVGIIMTGVLLLPYILKHGISSAGLFWCYKKDFDAIGGFNEALVTVEDVDFAIRLKAHGKTLGRRFSTLRKGHIITSCRKFDRFGDWYFFKNPTLVKTMFKGTDKNIANKYWYDFKREREIE